MNRLILFIEFADFSDFFNNESRVPDVNIIENDESFLIDVAAPGLSKEDFKIKRKSG